MQETQFPSLGWEDPLEKEMATDSRILAWEIPWTEEPGRLQSMRLQKSWIWLSDWTTTILFFIIKDHSGCCVETGLWDWWNLGNSEGSSVAKMPWILQCLSCPPKFLLVSWCSPQSHLILFCALQLRRSFHLITTLDCDPHNKCKRQHCHPHFSEEETGAQRGWVTCLSLHS